MGDRNITVTNTSEFTLNSIFIGKSSDCSSVVNVNSGESVAVDNVTVVGMNFWAHLASNLLVSQDSAMKRRRQLYSEINETVLVLSLVAPLTKNHDAGEIVVLYTPSHESSDSHFGDNQNTGGSAAGAPVYLAALAVIPLIVIAIIF